MFFFFFFFFGPTIQFVKNTHHNTWFASFELFSSAYEFQNV